MRPPRKSSQCKFSALRATKRFHDLSTNTSRTSSCMRWGSLTPAAGLLDVIRRDPFAEDAAIRGHETKKKTGRSRWGDIRPECCRVPPQAGGLDANWAGRFADIGVRAFGGRAVTRRRHVRGDRDSRQSLCRGNGKRDLAALANTCADDYVHRSDGARQPCTIDHSDISPLESTLCERSQPLNLAVSRCTQEASHASRQRSSRQCLQP